MMGEMPAPDSWLLLTQLTRPKNVTLNIDPQSSQTPEIN